MSDLLPCPFCGEAEELMEDGAGIIDMPSTSSNWVVCETCGGCGPMLKDGEKAVEAWNRRPQSDLSDLSEYHLGTLPWILAGIMIAAVVVFSILFSGWTL